MRLGEQVALDRVNLAVDQPDRTDARMRAHRGNPAATGSAHTAAHTRGRNLGAGCPPGGHVLDPFSGAGTTGLAALQIGRSYGGIDISSVFHDQALTRLRPRLPAHGAPTTAWYCPSNCPATPTAGAGNCAAAATPASATRPPNSTTPGPCSHSPHVTAAAPARSRTSCKPPLRPGSRCPTWTPSASAYWPRCPWPPHRPSRPYLTEWVTSIEVDENTSRGYQSHVRVHHIPHLGHLTLDKLRPRHVRAMFAAIEARNTKIRRANASDDPDVRANVKGRRPTSRATQQRVRASPRKALNDAIADGLITGPNAAALVQIKGDWALPIVWEPERIAAWSATGKIPGPVMVWPDHLVAQFLDYAAEHAPDLHPMFHFIAYRGPRRGEACGLLEAEVRLGKKETFVVNQIAVHGNTPVHKPPKSRAANRDLILDDVTTEVLRAYHVRKAEQRLAHGPAWPHTGLFFVRPDGRPWHPNTVSQRFRRLVKRAGLPPIRLHDLRHGAATLALAAGVDVKVVQEQLGHSTSTLTATPTRAWCGGCTGRPPTRSPRRSPAASARAPDQQTRNPTTPLNRPGSCRDFLSWEGSTDAEAVPDRAASARGAPGGRAA